MHLSPSTWSNKAPVRYGDWVAFQWEKLWRHFDPSPAQAISPYKLAGKKRINQPRYARCDECEQQ